MSKSKWLRKWLKTKVFAGLMVAVALSSCGAGSPSQSATQAQAGEKTPAAASEKSEGTATTQPASSAPSTQPAATGSSTQPTPELTPPAGEAAASRPSETTATQAEAGKFDHGEFDGLLRKYVKAGLVRYDAWKENQQDLRRLNGYLAEVATADVSAMSRNEKLAFYINAYNAITVQSILDAYPVKSIKDIPKVWDREAWTVAGQTVSLNMIEHKILRPTYKDGRLHFVLVCAAKGCPPLQSVAYQAAGIDKQMDRVTTEFLNDPARTTVDPDRRILEVSSLFDWYGDDFGATPRERAAFVARFWDDPATADALRNGEWTIRFKEYDWALNLAR